MSTTITREPMPDDDELERIALASLPVVLGRIASRPKRRRRLLAVGAGIAVLAGAAVAAIAPVFDPDDGIGSTGEPSVFALDCYDASGTKTASTVFAKGTDITAASTDPTGTCIDQERSGAVSSAVSTEAMSLHDAGGTCGVILVTGETGDSRHWEWLGSDGDGTTAPGVSTTNVAGSWDDPAWTTACDGHVMTIPRPAMPSTDVVACAEAANWTRVYVAGGRTAAEVCGAHGLAVWGG